jgi:hypothetical protein
MRPRSEGHEGQETQEIAPIPYAKSPWFDPDAKIFRIPCGHEDQIGPCGCIDRFESYNDIEERFKQMCMVNEDLVGPA